MNPRDQVLQDRRKNLLQAISANDLHRMHERVMGRRAVASSGTLMRGVIFRDWDTYAEEIRHWCEFAITGGVDAMTKPLDPDHVEWSRQTFRTLRDGGGWGVPRSGLIFTKRGKELQLTARMPHDPAMPISPLQLKRQQLVEFGHIKRHFEAAGIPVVDLTRQDDAPQT